MSVNWTSLVDQTIVVLWHYLMISNDVLCYNKHKIQNYLLLYYHHYCCNHIFQNSLDYFHINDGYCLCEKYIRHFAKTEFYSHYIMWPLTSIKLTFRQTATVLFCSSGVSSWVAMQNLFHSSLCYQISTWCAVFCFRLFLYSSLRQTKVCGFPNFRLFHFEKNFYNMVCFYIDNAISSYMRYPVSKHLQNQTDSKLLPFYFHLSIFYCNH